MGDECEKNKMDNGEYLDIITFENLQDNRIVKDDDGYGYNFETIHLLNKNIFFSYFYNIIKI